MTVPTFTKTGTKATAPAKLDKAIFGVTTKDYALLKEAYTAHQANTRENRAVSKTRGLVRGGGKKPWRQKGTGRARAGSIRSPLWRGGGAIFGPTGRENYSHKLNKNAKRQAIRQALSLKAAGGSVKVIEAFVSKDATVKATQKFLGKIEATGNILLVVSTKDALIERATGNLQNVKAVQAKYLSTYDILNADTIVITQEALALVTEWLSPSPISSAKATEVKKATENKRDERSKS